MVGLARNLARQGVRYLPRGFEWNDSREGRAEAALSDQRTSMTVEAAGPFRGISSRACRR